jgi:para-aminobenzoate synthetase component 1
LHYDLAMALTGRGTRRWQILDPGVAAVGLPVAAVRDRWLASADEDPHKTLQRLQTWHDAGLAVAGWLGWEFGASLAGVPTAHHGEQPSADLRAFSPGDLQPIELPEARLPTVAEDLPLAMPEWQRLQPDFLAQVAAALESIAAGEIYQVNLSVALQVAAAGRAVQPLPDYLAAVQAVQPVPLAFAWQGEAGVLVSGSMERFLQVVDGRVSSRPIKGTAPTGAAQRLPLDAKEVAENTMIVDMVRNDLRRVCRSGSVRVPALCEVEPYATVAHLESEVEGQLQDPHDAATLLAATLPPASVAGCPKVQALRVIARLERRCRGPYCGALGYWLPDGRADWSVGIRQAWLDASGATVQVGAGIVADSQPEREWQELQWKARATLAWLGRLRG